MAQRPRRPASESRTAAVWSTVQSMATACHGNAVRVHYAQLVLRREIHTPPSTCKIGTKWLCTQFKSKYDCISFVTQSVHNLISSMWKQSMKTKILQFRQKRCSEQTVFQKHCLLCMSQNKDHMLDPHLCNGIHG